MAGRIRVGIGGWVYAPWRDNFYPAGLRQKDELAYVGAHLTATEIIEFLKWLTAPACIINKAPSAGLFDGQTDEDEMGVSYHAIDSYINGGEVSPTEKKIIDRYHRVSEHKRSGINVFKQIDE